MNNQAQFLCFRSPERVVFGRSESPGQPEDQPTDSLPHRRWWEDGGGRWPVRPLQGEWPTWPICTSDRWVQWGRWMFRHRERMFGLLGALLYVQGLAAYCQQAGSRAEGFSAASLAGLVLVGGGVCMRVHVAGRAPPGASSRGITFEAGQLVTSGLYAYVRNPLYLANLMIWGGLALLVAPAWWVGVFLGLAAFFYHSIVLAEEDFLFHRFGRRYMDYCGRVGRWIPRLWGGRAGAFRSVMPSRPGAAGNDGFVTFSPNETTRLSPGGRGRPGRRPGRVRGISAAQKAWTAAYAGMTHHPLHSAKVLHGFLFFRLPETVVPGGGGRFEDVPFLGNWPSGMRREGAWANYECKFTWRRALFREADTLMLILLAGWALGGLGQGRLPWEAAQAGWGRGWLAVLGLAAIGWGWIKGLKKRCWPANAPTASAPPPSKPGASFLWGAPQIPSKAE